MERQGLITNLDFICHSENNAYLYPGIKNTCMDIAIVCVLLAVGVVFFLLELFLLPGISVAGVAGLLCTGAAIVYAYVYVGAWAGTLTLLGGLAIFALMVWWFMRSKALDKMMLKTEIKGKVDPLEGVHVKPGDTGTALSRLAPMGKVIINNATMEAKTNGEFIDQGVEVVVLEVYSTNVLVQARNKE